MAKKCLGEAHLVSILGRSVSCLNAKKGHSIPDAENAALRSHQWKNNRLQFILA